MPDYSELVSHIVRELVSRPDDVRVEIEGQGHHYLVRIWTAPEDLGRVIGRQGRNVEALRMVVRSASLRSRDRVQIEVVD